MTVLKKRPQDTRKTFKVKLSEELIKQIDELQAQANAMDADFPVDEIVELALRKSVKKAKSEIEAPKNVSVVNDIKAVVSN